MQTIRWTEPDGKQRTCHFRSPAIAVLDRKSDLLIVVVHFSDPQYRRPSNAIVIRHDGTLDHAITPPVSVEQLIEQMPNKKPVLGKYAVEAIFEVLEKNGRVVVGLNFNYEWIERRYYDPAIRQWQERDHIYRK